MTSEICENCGMLKTSHPTRYCQKFKPKSETCANCGHEWIRISPHYLGCKKCHKCKKFKPQKEDKK